MLMATELPVNSSQSEQFFVGEILPYIIIEIIISFFAFFNNTLVLVAIYKFKNLQTNTYRLIGSLAIADIAVALLANPSGIVLRMGLLIKPADVNATAPYSMPALSQGACSLFVSSVLIFTQVSIFNLLAIAIDRYVAIYHSLRYQAIVTSIRLKISIGLIWILGSCIGVIPHIAWYAWKRDISNNSSTVCAFEYQILMEFMVYCNFFAFMLVPFIVMFILYFFIFRSAKKQIRKIYADVLSLNKKSKSSLSSLKDMFKIKTHFNEKKHHKNRSLRSRLFSGHLKKVSKSPSTSNGEKQVSDRKMPLELFDSYREYSKEWNDSKAFSGLTSAGGRFNSRSDELSVNKMNSNESIQKDNSKMNSNESIEKVNSKMNSNESIKKVNSKMNSNESIEKVNSKMNSNESIEKVNSKMNSNESIEKVNSKTSSVAHGYIEELSTVSNEKTDFELQNFSLSTVSNPNKPNDLDLERRKKNLKRRSKYIKKEFRAAHSLLTVVGVFALCWLPLHIHNAINYFNSSLEQPVWYVDFAILLSHANSLVNPIIYAFQLSDMRTAFRKLFSSFPISLKTLGCPKKEDKDQEIKKNVV